MTEITAEIERVTRVIATVDVEKFCAYYHDERKDFEGSDEAFVRDFLESEGGVLLSAFPSKLIDGADGVDVSGDYDETVVMITFVA